MKVHELFEEPLTEAMLIEGVLASLQRGFAASTNYVKNLANAKDSHATLKSRDGQRGQGDSDIANEAKKYRKEVQLLYANATDKTKATIDSFFKKMGTYRLDGLYTSRNYYKDFISYFIVHTVLSTTKGDVLSKGLDYIVDKLFGIALVAVTGIPALDDIRDVAQIAKAAVNVTNTIASKLNTLAA